MKKENKQNKNNLDANRLNGPINLTGGRVKKVVINAVSDPMDYYMSPHKIDLSQVRYIERSKPKMSDVDFNSDDKNYGFYIQASKKFFSINNSEIVIFIKNIYSKIFYNYKKAVNKVDMSASLPLVSDQNYSFKNNYWSEITLINILLFLFSKIILLFNAIAEAFKSFFHILFAKRDNTVGESPQVANIKAQKTGSFKIIMVFNGNYKPVLLFLITLLLISLPIKFGGYLEGLQSVRGQVLGQAETAVANLNSAKENIENMDFENASLFLISAKNNFSQAKKDLNKINSFIAVLANSFPIDNSYKTGKNLIEAGEKLSSAGYYLIKSVEYLSSEESLINKITNFRYGSYLALEQILQAEKNLNKVNIDHLPDEYKEDYNALSSMMPVVIQTLKQSQEVADFAVNFLAQNDYKRYLLVFQNDNELRATGGFMGSFALLDIKNGEISGLNMPAGGTYDLRAGLKPVLLSPPAMQLLNPRWEFQDANWWPDFPTSAKNIMWFYEKSGGPTVDGVIAINSDWFARLLKVIGPIRLSQHNKTFTSSNFELEMQQAVELEYDDSQKPKQILADLAPAVIDKIFASDTKNILSLASHVSDGLKDRDIQLYFKDEKAKNFIVKNLWQGEQLDYSQDYLSVVATNIGGGKTDTVVDQDIIHNTEIFNDGTVINSIVIKRSHLGAIDNNFTNVANRSYLRIYVPLGSKLISAAGFVRPFEWEYRQAEDYLILSDKIKNEFEADIDMFSKTRQYEENNRTVFANWLTINPGESREVFLQYKLPFKINQNKTNKSLTNKLKSMLPSDEFIMDYSLIVQKQSGSGNDDYTYNIKLPDQLSARQQRFEYVLNSDKKINIKINKIK